MGSNDHSKMMTFTAVLFLGLAIAVYVGEGSLFVVARLMGFASIALIALLLRQAVPEKQEIQKDEADQEPPRVRSEGRDEPGLRDVQVELAGRECDVVEGSVPEWITGTFYRQSGAAFLPLSSTIGFAYVHGAAHIAALRIQDGRVLMTNRPIETEQYADFRRTGERKWANPHEFAKAKICKADSEKLYQGPNPNVTVWKLGTGTEIAALSEGPRGRIIAVDEENLDTLRVVDTVDSDEAFLHAAHFYEEESCDKLDHSGYHAVLTVEATGADTYAFGYAIYYGDASKAPLERVVSLTIVKFPRSEAGTQPEEKRISYMHTLAVTANFVVLMASARRLDYEAFLASHDGSEELPGFFKLWPVTEKPAALHIFRRSQSNPRSLEYVGEQSLERCHMVRDQRFCRFLVLLLTRRTPTGVAYSKCLRNRGRGTCH